MSARARVDIRQKKVHTGGGKKKRLLLSGTHTNESRTNDAVCLHNGECLYYTKIRRFAVVQDHNEYDLSAPTGVDACTSVGSHWHGLCRRIFVKGALQYALTDRRQIIPSHSRKKHQLALPLIESSDFSLFEDDVEGLARVHIEQRKVNVTVAVSTLGLMHWQWAWQVEQQVPMLERMGFASSDMEEVRRLITQTSPMLLIVTVVVSFLHMCLDVLAFRSDAKYWLKLDNAAVISPRAVVLSMVCDVIIFLYLLDEDATMLVWGPVVLVLIVDGFKCYKIRTLHKAAVAGVEDEADAKFVRRMCLILAPTVATYSVYTLLYVEQKSIYSWVLSSLTSV